MELVQKLSKNISVICTIHQPSGEIMEKFSHLLLLKAPGEVTYFGPLNELSSYFVSVGMGECPPTKNIADFALLAIGNKDLKENPSVLFEHSPQYKKIMAEIESGIVSKGEEEKVEKFDSEMATGFFTQFHFTFWRFSRGKIRDKASQRGRYASSIFLALVIGSLYYGLGLSQQDAVNRMSLVYLVVLYCTFSTQSTIPLLISQRPLYFRESQSKMYSPVAFYLARVSSDFIFVVLDTLIFPSILYWMVGFVNPDHGGRFGLFLAMFFICRNLGFAYTEFIANISASGESATAMSTVVLTLMMLFCGFLIQEPNIPHGWIWMYYISFFRYPINFLATNELKDLNFPCPTPGTCPITDGADLLNQYNSPVSSEWTMFYATIIYMIGLRFCGFLAFRFKQHIKR